MIAFLSAQALACGPDFPDRLLDSDREAMASPEHHFVAFATQPSAWT